MELKRQCGGRGPGGGTGARSGWPGLSAAARGFVAGREPGCGGGVSMRSVGDPSQGAPPLRPPLYLLALLFSLSLPR